MAEAAWPTGLVCWRVYGGRAMETHSIKLPRIGSSDKTQFAWSDIPDPQYPARKILVGATGIDQFCGLDHLQLSRTARRLALWPCVPKSFLGFLTRPSAQL